MKSLFYILIALCLLGTSVFFFHQSTQLLLDQSYLGGLLHIFVGFATIRAGVEFARLAVVLDVESR
jgi:hypothetical protein